MPTAPRPSAQRVRREVMNGTRSRTSGGLTAKDLKYNPTTKKYVSRKASKRAKKMYANNNLKMYKAPAFGN
jgi:hypothetical protein